MAQECRDTYSDLSDFLFYRGEDGNIHAQVILGKDKNGENTVLISQSGMADVFGIDRTGIGKHIKNIFDEQEEDEDAVSAKIAHTASDGYRIIVQYLMIILLYL